MFGFKRKPSFPVPDKLWLSAANFRSAEIRKYTPDISRLCQYEGHLLFVADELMRQRRKHDLIRDCEFKGAAITSSPLAMVMKDQGKLSFPVILDTKSADDRPYWAKLCQIKGELFAVPTSTIVLLDKAKENRVSFLRQKITIDLTYRKQLWNRRDGWHLSSEIIHKQEVWTYLGVPTYWNPQINEMNSFQPAKRFHPNSNSGLYLKDYYFYLDTDVKPTSK